jgi:hypothetical protein
MKYPDIIGSSDKKFRNYSYGKRPGKKLVKYSPVKAKINKLTSSIKNISLKKGVMKGVKFAGKAAFSPIGLSLAGGALITRQIKKELNEPTVKRQQQFNKKGLSIL